MSVPPPVLQIWKTIVGGRGFDRALQKITLVSAGEGRCVAEMKIEEEHTNSKGGLHGGLTSTIVDIISGIALSTHKNYPPIGVSVDLHVSSPFFPLFYWATRSMCQAKWFGICTFGCICILGLCDGKTVQFLSGATVGEDIVIEANTNKAGRTLAFLEVVLSKKLDGKIIARGLHTKYIQK